MPTYEFTPSSPLSTYVNSLCYSERLFAPPHDTFDILPDSMIELVWSFGPACYAIAGDQEHVLPECYAVGLLDAPLRIRSDGLLKTVRARCYPWGFAMLAGNSLSQAARHGLRGLLAADTWFAPLTPALAVLVGDAGRVVAALDRCLVDRALAATGADAVFVQAARQIIASKGNLVIEDLAQATFTSPRALRRMFQTILGAGPKSLARTARFEYVRDALWHDPDAKLSDLALAAGYADQAHLQREFRQFSWRTPRQFSEEMRQTQQLFRAVSGRNLQDS